jgi:hypothetical protein
MDIIWVCALILSSFCPIFSYVISPAADAMMIVGLASLKHTLDTHHGPDLIYLRVMCVFPTAGLNCMLFIWPI